MRVTLSIGLSLLLLAAAAAYVHLPGIREKGIFNIDPPTPYFRYVNGGSRGRVLVVHGLNADKSMMTILCRGLAEAGFEVFAIDLPGHGESTSPFNAVTADQTVARIIEKLGNDTTVLGHSLGGGFLADFARDHPVKNMVLFSPAPTDIDTVIAGRILLFDGRLELPPFKQFARHIEAAVEGTGTVEFHELPWTGHTGAVTQPVVIRTVSDWLGGDSREIHTWKRFGLLLAMLTSSVAIGILLLSGKTKEPPPAMPVFDGSALLVRYIAAAGAAVCILGFIQPAAWLRLFAGDYLIGFLFLTGAWLCLAGVRTRISTASLLIGIGAAAYVLVVPGFLVLSEFVQMNLPTGRFLRFLAIFGLSLPLCFADEMFIRPGRSQVAAGLRFLLTRALFAAIVVSATLIWSRQAAFLVLIMHLLVVFWALVWIAGALVYRRTRDPLATAVFTSILQAWFIASVFVTT